MKVTGMNSADLVSALYDSTTQGSNKKKDSNSIENLLTSNMSANNPAMAKLARKAESEDYYKTRKRRSPVRNLWRSSAR